MCFETRSQCEEAGQRLLWSEMPDILDLGTKMMKTALPVACCGR